MNELVFAPVIIATLNRVEHLKYCVESLSRCKDADKTELFISVDYPPNEKYKVGYDKVCAYLGEGISGFKSVHIVYQEKNLGSNLNFKFLQELVSRRFDRWILTEDDNEFSGNFLVYMNKGLDKFEKDDRILNICALQDKGPWEAESDNAIYQKNCPAYGLGCWRNKEIELEENVTSYLLNDVGKNAEKINYLYKTSKLCYQQYIEGILCGRNPIFWTDGNMIELCDTVRNIYAISADKYFIAPKISKARNWGNDGSGINMKRTKVDPCEAWKLDEDEDFEYHMSFDMKKILEYNRYIYEKMYKIPWIYVFKAQIKYWLYLLKGRAKICE